jgi:hypothetical protein
MRTGIPAILLVTPAAAGLGTRGVPACAQEPGAGATWAPSGACSPGRGLSKAGRVLVYARGRTLHRRTADRARAGWRPTRRAEREAVPAVQRSDS